MSTLANHVEDYLRLRRALLQPGAGRLPAAPAGGLSGGRGSPTLTTELAISWARLPAHARPAHWAARLTVARSFARYLQPSSRQPKCRPPPCSPRAVTPAPYLWSPEDIAGLLAGARALRPPLRAVSYEARLGLLAVSGMRVGEAVGLDRDDVDLGTGVITVRHAKFDRPRLVPLHPTTTVALRAYATGRDRLCPARRSMAFFVSGAGTRLNRNVAKVLRKITTAMGCAPRWSARPPTS